MNSPKLSLTLLLFLSVLNLPLDCQAQNEEEVAPLTPGSVIANSSDSDWRKPDQNMLLHLKTSEGDVIFELAPDFAPEHVKNLKTLVAQKYFDGLAIIRSQDNYVAQWGDRHAGTAKAKSQGQATPRLDGEYFRALKGVDLNIIESRDPYADSVGFAKGFAVGTDGKRTWLTHCYGALGAGRGMEQDSGNAAELYVVTGHAPRHLDRNVTLFGRAIAGIQNLSSLPRGTGPLGFYETPEEGAVIISIRLGSDVPTDKQSKLEIMRTDTGTFKDYVRSRTFRLDAWFLDQTAKIGLCNVGVPVREATIE